MSYVKLFIERSVYGRGLTRWGGRTLLAFFLLASLKPLARPPRNIFDSLSDQLRETTICLTRVPLWFSVLLILVGYRFIYGALWSSIHRQIQPADAYGLDTGVSQTFLEMAGNRDAIRYIWRHPDFAPRRRRLIRSAFLAALMSGFTSTAIAAAVLVWLHLTSLISWVIIVISAIAITAAEKAVAEKQYERLVPRAQPPDAAEAAQRLAFYLSEYPQEARTGSPLVYAYSGLSRYQIAQEFGQRAMEKRATRAPRFVGLLLVAILYPLVPAPNIEPLSSQGVIGCLYVDLYTFFRIAQDNIAIYAAIAIIALLAAPASVLLTDMRFMREYSFPVKIQAQVLRRERPFALQMMTYTLILAPIGVALTILCLYVSATVASWSHSAILGICALWIPILAIALVASRLLTRQFRGH